MISQTTLEKLNEAGKVYGTQAIGLPLAGVGSTISLSAFVKGYPLTVVSLAFSTTLSSLTYRIYEDIPSTGGVAGKVINRNRLKSQGKSAPFDMMAGVSFTPDVDKVISQGNIGVDRRESINEIISFEAGLILRPNTNYVFELESGDTAASLTDLAIVLSSCGNTPAEVI